MESLGNRPDGGACYAMPGELYLSPIGLAFVSKCVPAHARSTAIGFWFLASGFAGPPRDSNHACTYMSSLCIVHVAAVGGRPRRGRAWGPVLADTVCRRTARARVRDSATPRKAHLLPMK